MKSVTAKDFHKRPRSVYKEAAKKDGAIPINHDHYPELIFELTARDRQPLEDSQFSKAELKEAADKKSPRYKFDRIANSQKILNTLSTDLEDKNESVD